MASTYTAAGIELITQGEQAGAWGDTTNTNWELIEEMVGGVVSVALSSTSETLTTSDGASSDGRHAVINFTGSPGGTCTVTISPNDMQKVYFALNNSDETVTLSQGSGANVNIAAGKAKIVYCDGAGAGAAVVDISSGFDATTLAELGVTASAAELNTLDGITADVNELNLNDGASAGTIANSKTVVYGASGEVNATTLQLSGTSLTASATELNYVDGVTSSIQTQLDAMVEKAGDTMTGALTLNADPSSALHAATKQYVDTQTSAGIHYHDPVRGEVETNLSATYNNGSSGVGATLTATSNGAFNAGGISDWSTSERVLVYSQTDATENGVYTVTTVGDGSNPYVLTRATDADSAGASDPDALGTGDAFFVQEGDGAGELYVMNTEGTITFGTTDISFTQISSAAIYSAGTGLDLTGTVFSHDDTSSQASVNNSGNTFIQDVTLDGFGHVTALTSATAVINDGTLTMATSGTGLSGSASFTANDSDNVTFTVTSNATNANTAGAIVARDGSGNFSAGTITAALSGNATTSSSCSGNAATATTLETARTIGGVSFNGSANINLPGVNTTGNQNTSGNAATATALATARSIGLGGDLSGSANFDGTANITITATVANDSHTHDGRYFTETESDARYCLESNNLSDLTNAATARSNLGLGALATLSSVTASQIDADAVGASEIAANAVGASELNVSGNGTTSQFLRSDGDGTFTWATPTDTNTTYSAGAGLDLSSTTFSVESDLRGDVYYIGQDTNDYIHVNTAVIDFRLDGNLDMRLENDGDLHVDGDVIAYSTTTSDPRLKDNIQKVEGALDMIDKLNGYTFTYKVDGRESAGVMSTEVKEVLPSAVRSTTLPLKSPNGEDDNTEYDVVQYDQLHAVLIEAVKELSAKVKELEAKVG
jgi:hypothetical protein